MGIEGCFALGVETNPDPVGLIVHDGREKIATLLVTEGIGVAAAHCGDQRVGGSKVDADGSLVLMRNGALAGLGDLQ